MVSAPDWWPFGEGPTSGSMSRNAVSVSDLTGLGNGASDLLRNPKGYVLGIVGLWVIQNVFLRPARWVLGMIDWMFAELASTRATVETSLLIATGPAGEALLAVPETVHLTLSASMQDLGLAAPLAATVSSALLAVIVVTVVVAVARIVADAIPGLGGLIR